MECYLDNSATTRVFPEVADLMYKIMTEDYGNPSSMHQKGVDAEKYITEAKNIFAGLLKASEKEIFFTSGGTESDNWAIIGTAMANKRRGNHIITTMLEHPAVLETYAFLEEQGFEVTRLGVNANGQVEVDTLKEALREDTILVSVMFANNEIGTIQPIKKLAEIAHNHGVCFHTDAVQAVAHVEIDVKELGVDLLSMSAHKFGGPKGIGALYIKKGVRVTNLLHGGQQELGRRATTENLAGIVGMAAALKLAMDNFEENTNKMKALRERYINAVLEKIPYCRLNGHRTERLPGNTNISFQFIEGEAMLLLLDMYGIAASSGSACTSGSLDPSHVLLAIGLPHGIAHGSLRVTFSHHNTEEEVDKIVEALEKTIQRLRDMSPLYEKVRKGE